MLYRCPSLPPLKFILWFGHQEQQQQQVSEALFKHQEKEIKKIIKKTDQAVEEPNLTPHDELYIDQQYIQEDNY